MPLNVGSSLTFKQLTTTAPTAPSGHQSLYAKSNGALAWINSSGLEQELLDGADWMKATCRAASTVNLTFSGTQTIDGVVLVAGDRVLAKNQTVPAQNGIYVVAAGAWSRASDANTSALIASAAVAITEGTQTGRSYQTSFKATDTLGTTAMTWAYSIDTSSGATLYASINDQHLFRDARAVIGANVSLASTSTTQDGITLVAGDRVLLVNQTTGSQNGIYLVGTVGAGTAPLTRDIHFNTSALVANAGIIEITEGTIFGGGGWMTTFKTTDTLDTTTQTWGQVPSPHAQGFQGLVLSGNDTATGSKPSVIATGTAGNLLTQGASLPTWSTANLQLLSSPVKDWVVAATTANITLSAPQTIDGISVVAGNRVLVKNQTTVANNGVYVAAAGAWTRATGFDTTAEAAGAQVTVSGGTINGGTVWYTNFKVGNTLGTTAMVWLPESLSGVYTPAWTGATTNPVIGNGVASGVYTLTGPLCFFALNITSGSTTTYGTGQYSFSVPFAASSAVATYVIYGQAGLSGGNPFMLTANLAAGANTLPPKSLPPTAGNTTNNMTNTAPATFANGSFFRFSGTYNWA